MSYKTILVHLDNSKRCAARVEAALRLAESFDAHLVGLHALTRVVIPGYLVAEAGASIVETQKRALAAQAARSKEAFNRSVATAGWSKAEWRATDMDAVEAVASHARYADLFVIGQPLQEDIGGVEPSFAERAVLAAGRPALIIPYAGSFSSIGKRVVVAWKPTREATRALTDAIPMLRKADLVNVVSYNVSHRGAEPDLDIALFLSRHGVRVEARQSWISDGDVGNALLSSAADLGADLIVMGAYGHWRLREWITGGVTRTVFDSMTVPVLMSH